PAGPPRVRLRPRPRRAVCRDPAICALVVLHLSLPLSRRARAAGGCVAMDGSVLPVAPGGAAHPLLVADLRSRDGRLPPGAPVSLREESRSVRGLVGRPGCGAGSLRV